MNFFKKLFGFDSCPPDNGEGFHTDTFDGNANQFHGSKAPDFPRGGFEMFSDPMEMHRYFEQQMDEMLRTFGFHSGLPRFRSFFSPHGMPAIEDDMETRSNNVRDHFLKKGYEHPESSPVDKDVDKEFNLGGLGSIIDKRSTQTQTPYQPRMHSSTFGQSVMVKTIRNPDGSLETHKTIKSSDGSEETQITRKLGEKEYSIIKKRDRNGQEEVIENLVNIEEGEKQNFLSPKIQQPKLQDGLSGRPSMWDTFFK